MESVKSFYNIDYIIEFSEKRIDQYSIVYQSLIGKITNIILIYSGIGIYLVPVVLDLTAVRSMAFLFSFTIFSALFGVSLFNAVRLVIPVTIGFMRMSSDYYQDLLTTYEQSELSPSMSESHVVQAKARINALLKASYLNELAGVQMLYRMTFYRKASFYLRAITWGLYAVVPFAICVGFHVTKKEKTSETIAAVSFNHCKKINRCGKYEKAGNEIESVRVS